MVHWVIMVSLVLSTVPFIPIGTLILSTLLYLNIQGLIALFWSYILWFVIFFLPDGWWLLMCYFSYSSWASRRFLHMRYMALVLSLLGGSYQLLFPHLIPSPWSAVIEFCIHTQPFAWSKYLWLIVVMSAAPKNSGNRRPWVHHLVRHTVSPFQGMRLHVCKTGFIVKIAGCGIYYQPLIS